MPASVISHPQTFSSPALLTCCNSFMKIKCFNCKTTTLPESTQDLTHVQLLGIILFTFFFPYFILPTNVNTCHTVKEASISITVSFKHIVWKLHISSYLFYRELGCPVNLGEIALSNSNEFLLQDRVLQVFTAVAKSPSSWSQIQDKERFCHTQSSLAWGSQGSHICSLQLLLKMM